MSWVAFEEASGERVVLDLQSTAVEVFRSRSADTVRMHLAMVRLGIQGPDQQGGYAVDLVDPDGRVVTTVRVPEPWWARVWPWIEQVRAAQRRFNPTPY